MANKNDNFNNSQNDMDDPSELRKLQDGPVAGSPDSSLSDPSARSDPSNSTSSNSSGSNNNKHNKRNLAILLGALGILIVGGAGGLWLAYQPVYTPKETQKASKPKAKHQLNNAQSANADLTDDPTPGAKIDPNSSKKDYGAPKMQKYVYRLNISKAGLGNTDGDQQDLVNKSLDMLAGKDFKGYHKFMKNNLNSYKFDKGWGKDVVGIYQDEQTYHNIVNNNDSISAQEAGVDFSKQVKTPESFAVLGLYFDQIARGRFILDPQSISPIGFNGVEYEGMSAYNDAKQIKNLPTYNGFDAAKQIFDLTGGNSVYLVHLKIEDGSNWIPYDCVIGENDSGQLAMLGYYTSSSNLKKITDKPLEYYYQPKFKQWYTNAADNQKHDMESGNVNVNKLYPWIEMGGPQN